MPRLLRVPLDESTLKQGVADKFDANKIFKIKSIFKIHVDRDVVHKLTAYLNKQFVLFFRFNTFETVMFLLAVFQSCVLFTYAINKVILEFR